MHRRNVLCGIYCAAQFQRAGCSLCSFPRRRNRRDSTSGETKWRIASTISDISKPSANSPSLSEFAACGNTVTSWDVGLKDLLPGFAGAECSGVARIAIPEQSVSPALKAPGWRDAFASKSPPFHDFVLVIAGVTFRRAHSADQSRAAEGLAFSGSNLSGSRYHSGPADSARWRAQPNVDFPALPPKAAGSPKTDRTEQAP